MAEQLPDSEMSRILVYGVTGSGKTRLIVALDYPRWLSLSRLIRRTVLRLVDRKTICNGNRESLRDLLARDSIIAWHFASFARKRRRMRALSRDPDGPTVRRFTSPRKVDTWLRALTAVG